MNDEKVIREKLKFYFSSNQIIHIKQSDGAFYNGLIKEINDRNLILLDKKLHKNVLIFFEEIERIEPFEEKIKEEGDNVLGNK